MAVERTGRTRRGGVYVLLAAVTVVAVVALALLATVLSRPAATSARTALGTAQPAGPTGAGPSHGGIAADPEQQRQRYRAYVWTATQDGLAVVGALAGLEGCRRGRTECMSALGEASDQVGALRRDLRVSRAPDCLVAADQQLQDALAFQQSGLDMARDAVRSRNHGSLAQGVMLTMAGLWGAAQAVTAARQSEC
jgi:hypothetical protein